MSRDMRMGAARGMTLIGLMWTSADVGERRQALPNTGCSTAQFGGTSTIRSRKVRGSGKRVEGF